MTSAQLTKYIDSTAIQVKEFLNQVATRMESSLHDKLNMFEEKLSTFEEKLAVIEAAASSSAVRIEELEGAQLAINTSLHAYMASDKWSISIIPCAEYVVTTFTDITRFCIIGVFACKHFLAHGR